eukprot:3289772-Prymnesium_polylepis.1
MMRRSARGAMARGCSPSSDFPAAGALRAAASRPRAAERRRGPTPRHSRAHSPTDGSRTDWASRRSSTPPSWRLHPAAACCTTNSCRTT